MSSQPLNFVTLAFLFVCQLCLLNATENGVDIEKRDAGTEAMAIQGTGTGSTTVGGPNCMSYTLSLSSYDVYYYTCCDGHMDTGGETVINWDCAPPRSTYARRNDSELFSCGGRAGEANARQRCDTRWAWLAAEDCFVWPECFKGVCPYEAENRGSALTADFCGDGRCDTTESKESCPVDCCQFETKRCRYVNNTCPEPCCAEDTCCSAKVGNLSVGQVWLVIIIGVVGGILLINFICCCCCWCCFRKCCCKKDKQSNVVV